ncbi:hypothetical protein M758_1G219800 [Ceratodon purpureus]|nr:hypothetical protein M758_1G219800 [Ceratodon purpureus]
MNNVSDYCLTKQIMRNYKKDFMCRPSMCHECEDAMKVANSTFGDGGFLQGKHHDVLSPSGKNVSFGTEANDPSLQLANIVVELDDGCVERIRMNDNESAVEVATKVCRKNDLPDKFITLLAEHIIDRYPTRPVDQKKEEVTENTTEIKESAPVKNQSKNKSVKIKSESKTKKDKNESSSESSEESPIESPSESPSSGDSKRK